MVRKWVSINGRGQLVTKKGFRAISKQMPSKLLNVTTQYLGMYEIALDFVSLPTEDLQAIRRHSMVWKFAIVSIEK